MSDLPIQNPLTQYRLSTDPFLLLYSSSLDTSRPLTSGYTATCAMVIQGAGCVVRTVTIAPTGVAEALCFVPGAAINTDEQGRHTLVF